MDKPKKRKKRAGTGRYHKASDGTYASKEYVEKNPERVVEETMVIEPLEEEATEDHGQ